MANVSRGRRVPRSEQTMSDTSLADGAGARPEMQRLHARRSVGIPQIDARHPKIQERRHIEKQVSAGIQRRSPSPSIDVLRNSIYWYVQLNSCWRISQHD